MKHSLKITLLLLAMFLVSQLIGLTINVAYSPEIEQEITPSGQTVNVTTYNLPYGIEPPQDQEPGYNFLSVLIALIIGIAIIFFIMKFRAEIVLRIWFFVIIILGLGITLTVFFDYLPHSSWVALGAAVLLAYFKVFRRNILVHNFTELLIYPGISAIFVPFFNIFFFIILLIIISIYDIYAVWHSGFMQKMAKYQLTKVRVFAGFFLPYIWKKEKAELAKQKKNKKVNKKIKVQVAILGGGDIVFPMILAGIVLQTLGLLQALIIVAGATLALAYLFYSSEKGKFYPAMPFLTIGCFIALGIAYLITLF